MRVQILTLFLLLGLAILGGCSPKYYKYPGRSEDFRLERENLNKYLDPAQYFPTYNAETDPKKKRDIRNEIINAHIFIIDLYFYKSSQITSLGRTAFSLGSDLAVLGLGIAGSVGPAATTKDVLTPIISGITGAKTPIDKHVFYEQTMPVLIGKCEALRQVRLDEINTKMILGIDQYPLTAALSDLEQYFQAGTIPYALVEITATAGDEKKKAQKAIMDRTQDEVEKIRVLQDEAGRRIRRFWKPDGRNINPDNEKKIVEALIINKILVPKGQERRIIADFISLYEYRDNRPEVLKYLEKVPGFPE